MPCSILTARSDTLSSEVWSRLPIELIREIILYLGSTSSQIARALRLVSRSTNVWVLPVLFRTLTFTTPDHITRFASTLLPKRKLHIPALKSNLHTFPRPLASYTIESIALVVNTRLPSVEIALASVAPAFARVKNLVITGQNLSSNAHWLRQHPIYPKQMMILHFGSPHMVNFREPIFHSVTHLYTSVLFGYRNSSMVDLPQLTHLAVHTRTHPLADVAGEVVDQIRKTLQAMGQLQLFVLVLHSDANQGIWMRILEPCLADAKFVLLPYFRNPRMEWQGMLEDRNSVWDRARAWRGVGYRDLYVKILQRETILTVLRSEETCLEQKKHSDPEWEVDLVQRENYSPYEGDPTERREATMTMFH